MKQLPPPSSQIQEVLYELINRFYIDRRTMMLSCNILNLTARISNLRFKGVDINVKLIKSKNKFNREVEHARYSLNNKKEAIKIYHELKSNQSLIPE